MYCICNTRSELDRSVVSSVSSVCSMHVCTYTHAVKCSYQASHKWTMPTLVDQSSWNQSSSDCVLLVYIINFIYSKCWLSRKICFTFHFFGLCPMGCRESKYLFSLYLELCIYVKAIPTQRAFLSWYGAESSGCASWGWGRSCHSLGKQLRQRDGKNASLSSQQLGTGESGVCFPPPLSCSRCVNTDTDGTKLRL